MHASPLLHSMKILAIADIHGNRRKLRDILASGYAAVAGAAHKVLVSHPPPFGLVDLAYTRKHGGSQAVCAALDEYAIQLVVCGHIHEARGSTQYNGTTVVNCGPAWMGFFT